MDFPLETFSGEETIKQKKSSYSAMLGRRHGIFHTSRKQDHLRFLTWGDRILSLFAVHSVCFIRKNKVIFMTNL